MTEPETPTPERRRPGTGSPNQRLADEIDAREYGDRRPELRLLMTCAVIALLVLLVIVRTNLEQAQTEADAAAQAARRTAAAAAATAAAGAVAPQPASERILDRAFAATLAELGKETAAGGEAAQRTAAYRALLNRKIAEAGLSLTIERFECARHLCAGSLRGDAAAYARLVDASAQPSIQRFDEAIGGDATQHRFLMAVDADDDAARPPAPAARP